MKTGKLSLLLLIFLSLTIVVSCRPSSVTNTAPVDTAIPVDKATSDIPALSGESGGNSDSAPAGAAIPVDGVSSEGESFSGRQSDNTDNEPIDTRTPQSETLPDHSSSPPYRLAFYYPWFPEAWDQQGTYPYTNYDPLLGFYDSSEPTVIQQHIAAMQYGDIEGAIASWWGRGHHTDQRLPIILANTGASGFHWSIYYEEEGQTDPSVDAIRDDLIYLQDNYGSDPNYFRIDDRFVVFVYADSNDDCSMVDRWVQANDVDAYLVLKVFSGYRDCPVQPDGWHQYAPAVAADGQGEYSYSISPGFWKVDEDPRLERDLARWQLNIQAMMNSGATFHLITTFNEWGEGSSVEAAEQWSSPSGYGAYLDALHGVRQEMTRTADLPLVRTEPGDPQDGVVLVGAGDIVDCNDPEDHHATAALLDAIPGIVFTAGDNVYESGTPTEFEECYDGSWGRHKARTRPAVGNHGYLTPDAAGYFGYFGAAAGDPDKGYYSYDHGEWHIVVLNSNCSQVDGCDLDSPQAQWLQDDLANHPSTCTLAYWHHPRFSSGRHGSDDRTQDFWQILYDNDVEVVLTGHDHFYERFAPQDPFGNADPTQGIREFVVGTGGKNHTSGDGPIDNSEVINSDSFGVLKLTLSPTGYDWQFIPVPGDSFTDAGSGQCH